MANWASSIGSSACPIPCRGWISFCSILFPRSVFILSGLRRVVVRRTSRSVSRLDLCAAALVVRFQHGAGLRYVQSIGGPFRTRNRPDLPAVSRRLSEVCAILFVLLGDRLCDVAKRRFRTATRASRSV